MNLPWKYGERRTIGGAASLTSNYGKQQTSCSNSRKEEKKKIKRRRRLLEIIPPSKRSKIQNIKRGGLLGYVFTMIKSTLTATYARTSNSILIIIEDEEGEPMNEDKDEEAEEIQDGISINALMGNKSKNTLKITCQIGKKQLNVLIDSGNTRSFIDVNATTELYCVMEEASPWVQWLMEAKLQVDLNVLNSNGICRVSFILLISGCSNLKVVM